MSEFYVKVVPESDEFKIDTSGSFPKVFLENKAENGRANHELLTRLSEILGVKVGIVSGHSSRRKKLVADIEKDEVEIILGDY